MKKVRTVRSLGALVLKSHCFFIFLQLVSQWAMQQQLLPTPPTCTLERILPSKQVCKPTCAGWQKCFVNVTVGECKGDEFQEEWL